MEVAASVREPRGAARVLSVLRELAHHPQGIRLESLCREYKSPKSTMHRTLAELRKAGLVEQDEDGRYRLALEFVRLAFTYYEALDTPKLVEPTLTELSTRFAETAHYAELSGGDVVCLAKVSPSDQLVHITRVGGRQPAHCTAVGKALLAYSLQSDDAIERYIAQYGPLARRTPNTIFEAQMLAREFELIRSRGYSLDREESELGLVCLAVPLFQTSSQTPSGAISVTSLTHRQSIDDLERNAPEIMTIVRTHLGASTISSAASDLSSTA